MGTSYTCTIPYCYLKEECEADPLVEPVLHSLLLIVEYRSHPWVSNILSSSPSHMLGQGEGGVDPAVGIHHSTWDSLGTSIIMCFHYDRPYIHYAVNGVSKELSDRDEHAAREDEEGGGLAVKAEH